MTVLDGERDKVTNAEQKSTQERTAGVGHGAPSVVRPLLPLANCRNHMRDVLHDLIVLGFTHDSQLQSDDQITVESPPTNVQTWAREAVANGKMLLCTTHVFIIWSLPISSFTGNFKPLWKAWLQHSVHN